jgi:FkbM family methyltransferase
MILGSIDGLDRHLVSGWAYDTLSPDRALTVSVFLNDRLLFQKEADAWRSDLAGSGIGNGCHAFCHAFLHPIGEEEVLEISVVAGGQQLSRSPSLQKNPSDSFIVGSIEKLDSHGVAGWAYNSAAPNHTVSVSIFIGDNLLDCVDADLFRMDLETASAGNGQHGFRYPFSEKIGDTELSKVCVRVGPVNLPRFSPLAPFDVQLVESKLGSRIGRIWSEGIVFRVELRPTFEITCDSVIGRVMRLLYREFPPTADRINPILHELCEVVKNTNCDRLHLEKMLVHLSNRTEEVEVSRTNTQFIGIDRGIPEFSKGYEPEIQVSIDLIVPDNGVLLDIGSNWGCFSIFLATRPGFFGKIYAFEPSSQSFQNLTKLVNDLKLNECVVCQKLGLADYSGTARLSIGLMSGLSSTVNSVAENYAITYEEVRISPLDDLSLPKADLIKIDVEGVEAKVIRGGENYIRSTEPAIIFESWIFSKNSKSMRNTSEPLEILKGWGYDFFLPCWTNSDKSHFSPVPIGEESNQFFALCPFELEDRTLLDERINILALPKGKLKAQTSR